MTSASSSNGSRCGHVAWGMANGSAAVAPSQSRPSDRARPGLQHADNTHTHTHTQRGKHTCAKLFTLFMQLPQVAGNFYFRSHFVFVSCSILPASSRPSERHARGERGGRDRGKGGKSIGSLTAAANWHHLS